MGLLAVVLAVSTLTACADITLVPRGEKGGYLTLAQIDEALVAIAEATAPHSSLTDIGTSVEGRPIRALCLGTTCANITSALVAPSSPAALFTGLMHAREPLGMMACIHYAATVASAWRSGKADAVALLNHRTLHFVPAVNPDGYAANLAVWGHPLRDLMRRKNRRRACNSGDSDTGIDINRNFDFYFSVDDLGSSPSPCADDYRGPNAFSEPESVALRNLVLQLNFSIALNWHSYGRFVNLPWAVQRAGSPPPPVYDTYLNIAASFGALTGFGYGHPYDGGLYSCNGEASDWMLSARGTYAMSPELGPHMTAPFEASMWPSERAQPALLAEALAISARAAWAAGPLLEASVKPATGPSLVSCGAACAQIDLVVSIRNNGVRRSDGALAVVLVDAGADIASAALCSPNDSSENVCTRTWGSIGLSLCGLQSASWPPPSPQGGLTCPAPSTRVIDEILGDTGPRALRGAVGADDISDYTSRRLEELVSRGSMQHRPTLARSTALLALTREMLHLDAAIASGSHPGSATAAGLNHSDTAPAALSHADAARGRTDSDHVSARLDASAVAAELDIREAASYAKYPRSRRALQSLDTIMAVPVTVGGNVGAAAVLRVNGGLGLDAQHEASPVALRLQLPVADAAACTARAATAVGRDGGCLGATQEPPAALLAISDETTCVVYGVSCRGNLTVLLRGATGCAPCALLRTSRWADIIGLAMSGGISPSPATVVPSHPSVATPAVSSTTTATPSVSIMPRESVSAMATTVPPPLEVTSSGPTPSATASISYSPSALTALPDSGVTPVNVSRTPPSEHSTNSIEWIGQHFDGESLAAFFITMIGVTAVVLVAFRRVVFRRSESNAEQQPASGGSRSVTRASAAAAAALPPGAPVRMAIVSSV